MDADAAMSIAAPGLKQCTAQALTTAPRPLAGLPALLHSVLLHSRFKQRVLEAKRSGEQLELPVLAQLPLFFLLLYTYLPTVMTWPSLPTPLPLRADAESRPRAALRRAWTHDGHDG